MSVAEVLRYFSPFFYYFFLLQAFFWMYYVVVSIPLWFAPLGNPVVNVPISID